MPLDIHSIHRSAPRQSRHGAAAASRGLRYADEFSRTRVRFGSLPHAAFPPDDRGALVFLFPYYIYYYFTYHYTPPSLIVIGYYYFITLDIHIIIFLLHFTFFIILLPFLFLFLHIFPYIILYLSFSSLHRHYTLLHFVFHHSTCSWNDARRGPPSAPGVAAHHVVAPERSRFRPVSSTFVPQVFHLRDFNNVPPACGTKAVLNHRGKP